MKQSLVDKYVRIYNLHTAKGYRFAKRHDYYDAMLEFESSCISLCPACRLSHEMSDRRPAVKKNIRLNSHCLKNIHVKPYKLEPLFDNDMIYETYFNVETWWQILDEDLKHFSSLFYAVSSYESAEYQNMFWNINVGLRARYGCLGLTVFIDTYTERHKYAQHINELAVMPANELLRYEQKSRQFNKN